MVTEVLRADNQPLPLPFASDRPVRPHVIIIGGGFAGIQATKAFKDAPVRVTLLDKHNYHLFQPLLYQVATASVSPSDIAYPIRTIFRRQSNVSVLMAEATRVDPAHSRVTIANGDELTYDYLIVAAGAEATYFGHDEWRKLAPPLKSIEDAIDMRKRVLHAFERAELETDEAKRRAALTFVVVGGGPTGVELAGALAELSHQTLKHEYRSIDPANARIMLVEGGSRLLDTYPPRLSRAAAHALERLGVEIHLTERVTQIELGRALVGEEAIDADTVLWSAGVQGQAIGATLGQPLAAGNRVPTRSDLSLDGQANVFVVGDLNGARDRKGNLYPGVAQVAIQQGEQAAKNILHRIAGEPTKPFHYFDMGTMSTIGRNQAVAQIGPLKLSGFIAWVIWAVIHIVSLIGFRSRIAVFWTWVWSYVTHGRGSRLITGQTLTPPV